jgi:hypothetical protein
MVRHLLIDKLFVELLNRIFASEPTPTARMVAQYVSNQAPLVSV